MARPTEPPSNTIVSIRVSCPNAGALANVLRALEGALGKPATISKPYANRDGNGARVYLEIVAPCASPSSD